LRVPPHKPDQIRFTNILITSVSGDVVKCLIFEAGPTRHAQQTKLHIPSGFTPWTRRHRPPLTAQRFQGLESIISVALISLAPKVHSEGNHPVRKSYVKLNLCKIMK